MKVWGFREPEGRDKVRATSDLDSSTLKGRGEGIEPYDKESRVT